MRPFGTLIEKALQFREPPVPGPRMDRVNPTAEHGLDDGIYQLFEYACISKDLEAAADLITLLDKWHARRNYGNHEQRRRVAIQLRRMQGELERRHIMQGTRPAGRNPA